MSKKTAKQEKRTKWCIVAIDGKESVFNFKDAAQIAEFKEKNPLTQIELITRRKAENWVRALGLVVRTLKREYLGLEKCTLKHFNVKRVVVATKESGLDRFYG